MGFIRKTFLSDISRTLLEQLTIELGGDAREAARIIDRGRVSHRGKIIRHKSARIYGEVTYLIHEPSRIEITPLAIADGFAVYDKPSGLLVHPKKISDEPTLLDAARREFGPKANIVHRLDRETSGLVIVAFGLGYEAAFRALFANHQVTKCYHGWVRGRLREPLVIDAPIASASDNDPIRVAMKIAPHGKPAQTHIEPLCYDECHDATKLLIKPLTGRQHQIRLHLFHVNHPLIGEPIYGLEEHLAKAYLEGAMTQEKRLSITGAPRLMLQAQELAFVFSGKEYHFRSQLPFKLP